MTWNDYRTLNNKIDNVKHNLEKRIRDLEEQSAKKDESIDMLMSENEMLKDKIDTLKKRLSEIGKKYRTDNK